MLDDADRSDVFAVFLVTAGFPLTLLLLLLLPLLHLAVFDVAQRGFADAPSVADGLQQVGAPVGRLRPCARRHRPCGEKERGGGGVWCWVQSFC